MKKDRSESLITEIEESKKKSICDFIEGSDLYNLHRYKFEIYVENALNGVKDIEILEIFKPAYKKAKEQGINITSDILINEWISPFLDKIYGIDEHIGTVLALDVPMRIPALPEKENLLSLFARALVCLGYRREYFNTLKNKILINKS